MANPPPPQPPPGGSYIGAFNPPGANIDFNDPQLPQGRPIQVDPNSLTRWSPIINFGLDVYFLFPNTQFRDLLFGNITNEIRPRGTFDREPVGSKSLTISMKYTMFHIVMLSEEIELLIEALKKLVTADRHSAADKEKMQKILRLYNAANALKLIHRFLHRAHPNINGDLLPDGSNMDEVNPTRNRMFEHEWKLHRHWIRFLHYPGLLYESSFGSERNNDSRPNVSVLRERELVALVRAGRMLQYKEVIDTTSSSDPDLENFPMDIKDPNRMDLLWLWPCRGRINVILELVARLSSAELIPASKVQIQLATMKGLVGAMSAIDLTGGPSKREIVDANLALDPTLLDRISALIDNSLSRPSEDSDPFLRLVIDLLDKEDTFESQLAIEHVEDKLIEKQFSLYDEENLAQSISGDPTWYFAGLQNGPDRPPTSSMLKEDWVYKIIEETSLVNRTRRNYRLLRDWREKRPWKCIYQLYDDTLPENQWLTQAIRDFDTVGTQMPYRMPPNFSIQPQNQYSSLRYVSQYLFGFRPMLPEDIEGLPDEHSLKHPCGLCSKPFVGNQNFGSSVVALHCTEAHHFHLNCIYTFWDEPGKYVHRCPTCGEAAQLNWERVGLDYTKSLQFAHNLMGWSISQDTLAHIRDPGPRGDKARADYDVPPMPPHRDRSNIDPNDVEDGALNFWMQQNMSFLCALENPVFWRRKDFAAGEIPRMPNTRQFGERLTSRSIYRIERGARELGRRWMNLDFDTGGRIRDPTQNVFDVNRRRLLPGARSAPAVEAAWARSLRRRRNRARRDAAREAGFGLGNLPGI